MLPVPKSLQPDPDDDCLAVRPIQFTSVTVGPYRVEYGFKSGDGIVHFFREGGGLYPASFRSRLYSAFQVWPGQLQIDWVDELQSWCVIVKGGGITPPHHEEIVAILNNVVS
jgi:hypothetical protein